MADPPPTAGWTDQGTSIICVLESHVRCFHVIILFQTGAITYTADRTTPTQFTCSSPSSDLDQPSPPEPYNMQLELDGPTPDNPLMSSLLPGPPPQGVQLMPPGEPRCL